LQPAQTQISIQTQPQAQTQSVPQQQHQAQAQASHSPVETHASVQPQPQVQKQQTLTATPFVFDPNATYPDQNVQAWAQYYAQGGTDPTGSVYFISVPGITDAPTSPTSAVQPGAEGQQQQATSATSFSGPVASALPGHIVTRGLQRQNSLPNPYGPTSSTPNGETASPVSAGTGMGGHAPWDPSVATTTTMSGQFAQMRLGEPSVGA
jgi:signal transducing adaptor molecule